MEHDGTEPRLSAAVRAYLERTRITTHALSQRCIDPETGEGLRDQWLRHLLQGRVTRSLEQWRYRALAAGLGVDVITVKRLAAAQWIGVDVLPDTGADSVGLLVDIPAGLPPADRQVVSDTASTLAHRLLTR
ncbi:hypothetical protein ACFFMN_23720 [Planobispora siamensis]|nr:hypothetical protein [Planobispora siamensis]